MMPPLHRRHVLSSGTALLLSACTNLIGPQPASQIYLLRPPLPQSATGSGAGGKVDWALAVARPDASDALDGDRIALTRTPTELDYYANAQWADRLPRLVQAALIAGFEASGRIAAVAREEDAVHADYELLTDIRDFEARYRSLDAAPDAAVTLISQIADSRSLAIVAGLNSSFTSPASANSVAAVVEAFDAALAKAVERIVDWALALPPPEKLAP